MPSYHRERQVDAVLPQAIGVAVLAESCFFFCIVTATFREGRIAVDEDVGPGYLRGKGTDHLK